MWTIFKVFIEICYNIASVLCFGFLSARHAGSFSCSIWTLSCVVCKLLVVACMWYLVPQPGIEPRPPALGAWSLTHWTTREVPILFLRCRFQELFPDPLNKNLKYWGPRICTLNKFLRRFFRRQLGTGSHLWTTVWIPRCMNWAERDIRVGLRSPLNLGVQEGSCSK